MARSDGVGSKAQTLIAPPFTARASNREFISTEPLPQSPTTPLRAHPPPTSSPALPRRDPPALTPFSTCRPAGFTLRLPRAHLAPAFDRASLHRRTSPAPTRAVPLTASPPRSCLTAMAMAAEISEKRRGRETEAYVRACVHAYMHGCVLPRRAGRERGGHRHRGGHGAERRVGVRRKGRGVCRSARGPAVDADQRLNGLVWSSGRGGYARQFRVRVRRLRGAWWDGREIAAVEGKPEAGEGCIQRECIQRESAQQGADDVGAQ